MTEAGCKSLSKTKGKEEKKKMSEEQTKEYNSFKYKFFLGKGNNYPLVRTILKQRWWWTITDVDHFEDANFIWTQWRKNHHIALLDSKMEVTK